MEFHRLLIQAAEQEGFPIAGALDIERALEKDFPPHLHRYDEWLKQGFEGAMSYLSRGRDRRADPRLVFPEARSILCVALPYDRRPAGSAESSRGPRYARYLRRQDYHEEIAARLERAMGHLAEADPGLRWKVCVDTSAVLERSWATLAGLGWIGKNTLLIHPRLGSYLFLGAVLLNRETGQGPRPLPNYCGSCTRCLKACPTEAFPKAGVLNANRCISYWTLEKRGSLELSEADRQAVGPWIAGCDVCQEVCPFNLKSSREDEKLGAPDPSFDHAIALNEWKALLSETEAEYRHRVRDSSLNRVKPAQFRRNLAIALANAARELDPAERWDFVSRLGDAVLARAASETDPAARPEWDRCARLFLAFAEETGLSLRTAARTAPPAPDPRSENAK